MVLRRRANPEPAVEELNGRLARTISVDEDLRPGVAFVAEFVWVAGETPVLCQLSIVSNDLADPGRGVVAADLRKVSMRRVRARADAQVNQYCAENPGWDAIRSRPAARRPGRPKTSDRDLVRLARDYVRVGASERSSAGVYRVLAIRDPWKGYSAQYLRKLVCRARKERGFLTDAPSTHGGGELTPAAMRLLTELGEAHDNEDRSKTEETEP